MANDELAYTKHGTKGQGREEVGEAVTLLFKEPGFSLLLAMLVRPEVALSIAVQVNWSFSWSCGKSNYTSDFGTMPLY